MGTAVIRIAQRRKFKLLSLLRNNWSVFGTKSMWWNSKSPNLKTATQPKLDIQAPQDARRLGTISDSQPEHVPLSMLLVLPVLMILFLLFRSKEPIGATLSWSIH